MFNDFSLDSSKSVVEPFPRQKTLLIIETERHTHVYKIEFVDRVLFEIINIYLQILNAPFENGLRVDCTTHTVLFGYKLEIIRYTINASKISLLQMYIRSKIRFGNG